MKTGEANSSEWPEPLLLNEEHRSRTRAPEQGPALDSLVRYCVSLGRSLNISVHNDATSQRRSSPLEQSRTHRRPGQRVVPAPPAPLQNALQQSLFRER